MALSADKLKESNRRFYNSGDALFSKTYSTPLSKFFLFCNTFGSILYICFSTGAALFVKKEFQIYAFVRQASQENLDGVEVLTWARSQAVGSMWDLWTWGILLLAAVLIFTQVATKLFIKKYVVYKLERRILLLTFVLTFLQWALGVLAVYGSIYSLSTPVAMPLAIAATVLIVVFLLGLSAAKLPYPLEFKQFEKLELFLRIVNRVAELIQRCILH